MAHRGSFIHVAKKYQVIWRENLEKATAHQISEEAWNAHIKQRHAYVGKGHFILTDGVYDPQNPTFIEKTGAPACFNAESPRSTQLQEKRIMAKAKEDTRKRKRENYLLELKEMEFEKVKTDFATKMRKLGVLNSNDEELLSSLKIKGPVNGVSCQGKGGNHEGALSNIVNDNANNNAVKDATCNDGTSTQEIDLTCEMTPHGI